MSKASILEILIRAKDMASGPLKNVSSSLGGLASKGGSLASGGLKNLKGAIVGIGTAAATAAVTGVVALTGAIAALAVKGVQAYASMQTMRASLETAFEGNIELAKQAEQQITKFAADTPFAVGEVMRSFIKLKNMGLDPSEEALRSYGDTASSMGKSLNDMVEAVADAAVGEFERLKEFGIRASSQGDQVQFTFKGVTTTVKKNSEEIEGYLRNLGEVNFAGGMERQSKTLTGLWSTFVDTINIKLAEFIEKSGIGQALTDGLSSAIAVLEKIDITQAIDMLSQLGVAFQSLSFNSTTLKENFMANFEAVRTYLVDTLYPQLQPVFTALQNFFIALQPIVEASLNAIMNVFNIAFPYIQQVMTDLVPIFEDAINRITQEILPLIIPIINQIVELFRILAPFIGPILTLLVEMIKNGVNTTITVVRGLLIFFRGFLDLMIGLFTNNHERVRRGFLGMFSGIAVAVGGIFKGIANSIINQVNALIRTVNVVLSKLPTGGNLRIPTLATFAKGTTYASGGTALVGENGPELVQLPTGAKVRTASTTASMSAGSGQTINIDARGALIDERGLLDLFRKYGIKLQTT